MATYLRPKTLLDALTVLAHETASPPADPIDRLTIMAGATDFFPAATTRQAWFQPTPANILDISAIAELHGLTASRIGAMASWSDVINADLSPAFDALKQASRQVGGVQIQNRGTLAGNLCNASPAADGVPPLLALDACVEVARFDLQAQRVESRRIALGEFILGNRKTALASDEMVVAVHVPPTHKDERSVFMKLGARSYLVISISSVAVNVVIDEAGMIASARIAVGACSAVPQRLSQLEQSLIGVKAALAPHVVTPDQLSHLAPLDDVRATAAYRLQAALVLVQRSLAQFALPMEKAALEKAA
jgi:CO/xanthine dehydrogenase FAD-binding subunit